MEEIVGWDFGKIEKRGEDEEFTIMILETEHFEYSFKIKELRHLIEDADNRANYSGK